MGLGLSHSDTVAQGSRADIREEGTMQLVVLRLDGLRYALALTTVERVVRAVAVTPLPKAPPIVLGVIDVGGRIIPVLNLRKRLRLPERAITPDDQLAIVRTAHRTVGLFIDSAEGVIQMPAGTMIPSGDIAPGLEYLRGVVQLPDGLVLIHDLDQFLSLDEVRSLDTALRQDKSRG